MIKLSGEKLTVDMDLPIKKTSRHWCAVLEIDADRDILDPDGWDRSSMAAFEKSFDEELISEKEFESRIIESTCYFGESPYFVRLIEEVKEKSIKYTNDNRGVE